MVVLLAAIAVVAVADTRRRDTRKFRLDAALVVALVVVAIAVEHLR